MQIASHLSLAPDDVSDVAAVAEAVGSELGGEPDLVLVFASPLVPLLDEAIAAVQTVLAGRTMLGCTAQGVIADGREVERAPSVAIWAAHAPELGIRPGVIDFVDADEGAFAGVPEIETARAMLVLADPFAFPVDAFLRRVDTAAPGLPCIGGLASGGNSKGETHLYLDGKRVEAGAVVAALDGPVNVTTLVSQGCRPVGDPYIVTRSDRNVIQELGGKRALDRLVEILENLDPSDRTLAENGLHIGRVIDESKTEYGRGDFLVRSLLGADSESGAIAIGDLAPVGCTIQVHVRDAGSADEDLRHLLGAAALDPAGGVLFTCNGRGRNLFAAPDHDVRAITQQFAGLPLAGFFAAGEIGPIGGHNFLHGFTASAAFFGR